jgi:hypothetical protein
LCDDDQNLHALAKWTARHGGKFILGSGLTLADQQKEFFMRTLSQNHPNLISLYTRLYPEGSYAQAEPWRRVGSRLREFCWQAGLSDRIPRPIIPGEKRSHNKRIVEQLANKLYTLELENASSSQIWAFRKAAWAVEDLEQDIGLVFRSMGFKGLESIPNVSRGLAKEIEGLLASDGGLPNYLGS